MSQGGCKESSSNSHKMQPNFCYRISSTHWKWRKLDVSEMHKSGSATCKYH